MNNRSETNMLRAVVCAALAFGVTAAGRAASAQSTNGWALNRYESSTAGDTFFASEFPWYTGRRSVAVRFGLVADYARLPLVYRATASDVPSVEVIDNMLTLHAGIGLALFDRIGISLGLPVSLLQTGTQHQGLGNFGSPAAGDIRVGLRFRIAGDADRDPISLHIGGFAYLGFIPWVPRAANTSDGDFRGRAYLALAGHPGPIRYSLAAGFHGRPTTPLTGSNIGHEFYATAALALALAEDRLTIGPEVWMSTTFDGAFTWPNVNVEGTLGIHYLIADTILIGGGFGPGFTQGPGTPSFRGLFQLAYAPVHREAPAGPRDTDGDGVMDPEDECVTVPAGNHPDPAHRGCPIGDRDHDTVMDPDDQCIDVPRGEHPDPERAGCPDGDDDHDTVLNHADQCRTEAQGEHPDPDRAGCPDGDEDHDNVLNHTDQCRTVPAGPHPDPARAGCPLPDRDHDTVVDPEDHCPDQPGAPSPDPNRNGCPGLVQVEEGILRIMRPVFFATNRDRILPRSFPVLTAVSEALRASTSLRRIAVEGHTDDVGDDAANQELSRRRAQSVMRWLTEHQIDAARLEARGFGETQPLRQITGLRGRALRLARGENRRVIFRIVDPPASGETPSTPPTTPPSTPAPSTTP